MCPADASPAPQPAAPTTAGSKGEFEGVDASAPTTTLQIRLADGHRLTGAQLLLPLLEFPTNRVVKKLSWRRSSIGD